MDARVLLFLVVLGTSWWCNARVVKTNFSAAQNGSTSAMMQQMNQEQQEKEIQALEDFGKNEQLCNLCINIATPVLTFLQDSKNQEKIESALDKICSFTLSLKDKCSITVDSYLTMLFTAVEVLTPRTLCAQIGLCDLISPSQHLSNYSCESCHDLVKEVLLKLKDPDTQPDMIQVLLEACDVIEGFEGFAKKCKTLVSIYAPLILGNAEYYLEKYDICACSTATNAMVQTSMHSAS